MAHISLQKAKHLQEMINNTISALDTKPEKHVSIFCSKPDQQVADLRADLGNAMETGVRLLNILGHVRARIGEANGNPAVGITALLARKAIVERKLGLCQTVIRSGIGDTSALSERIQVERKRYEGKTDGYGITGDTVSVNVLDKAQHDTLKAKTLEFRREINKISGTLNELNHKTTIEIPDEDYGFLQSLGLI